MFEMFISSGFVFTVETACVDVLLCFYHLYVIFLDISVIFDFGTNFMVYLEEKSLCVLRHWYGLSTNVIFVKMFRLQEDC